MRVLRLANEWFENVLALLQSPDHEVRMAVVPRRDQDGFDIAVVYRDVDVGRADLRAVSDGASAG